MEERKFKLTIELVPATVWFSSLYKILPREIWYNLKREIYDREGRRCYICGSTKRLELHEFWEYDDEKHIQKLVGVHHLCHLCHKIKHIGFWCHTEDGRKKLEEEGLTREELIDHFCRVNRCSKEEFLEYEKEVLRIWEERSKYKWKQDFGEFKELLGFV